MKQKISSFQAVILLYTGVVPTAILIIPSVVMTHAQQDAWISIAGATLVGVCAAFLIGSIVKYMPEGTLQDWVGQRLGRVAGVVVGLFLTLYYLSMSAVILQDFAGIMNIQILPRTPPYMVMIIILVVVGFAVLAGIEVIARSNVFVTVISMVPYFSSLILFSNIVHFDQLLPIFQHKPGAIAYGGLLPVSWFSEIAILLILSPYLKNRLHARKIAIWGTVLSGIHLTFTVVLGILVFGSQLPQQYQYPSFSMIEVLRMGTILERIDILFVAFWICTMYIKMAVFLFGAYQCMVDTLKLRPSKPLLGIFLLFILLTTNTAFRSEVKLSQLNKWGTPYTLITFNILLPLLLSLVLLIRKKRPAKEENQPCGTDTQG